MTKAQRGLLLAVAKVIAAQSGGGNPMSYYVQTACHDPSRGEPPADIPPGANWANGVSTFKALIDEVEAEG